MRRTQIYLPEDQWKELRTLSQRQSTPVAALIRRALAQVYPVRHHSRFEHALDDVIGMWRDRSDLGATESYIRALRRDDRLERLAL
jgi:predicted ATPase